MKFNWSKSGIGAAILVMPGLVGAAQSVTLSADTEIQLETVAPLSSKTNVKGDIVALRTASDVLVDGRIVVPKGAMASGQISDARAKGALGMSGRLVVQPLYMMVGSTTVRLEGNAANRGSVSAGAVIGMAVLTPGFTGRSATIPAGTRLVAYVSRSTAVTVP